MNTRTQNRRSLGSHLVGIRQAPSDKQRVRTSTPQHFNTSTPLILPVCHKEIRIPRSTVMPVAREYEFLSVG